MVAGFLGSWAEKLWIIRTAVGAVGGTSAVRALLLTRLKSNGLLLELIRTRPARLTGSNVRCQPARSACLGPARCSVGRRGWSRRAAVCIWYSAQGSPDSA